MFVMHDYSCTSSTTRMLQELNGPELEMRRRELRLALFNKIVQRDVAVLIEGLLGKADSHTCSQHNYKYRHLRENIVSYCFSFFLSPYPVTQLTVTVNTFKKHLRKSRNPKQD